MQKTARCVLVMGGSDHTVSLQPVLQSILGDGTQVACVEVVQVVPLVSCGVGLARPFNLVVLDYQEGFNLVLEVRDVDPVVPILVIGVADETGTGLDAMLLELIEVPFCEIQRDTAAFEVAVRSALNEA